MDSIMRPFLVLSRLLRKDRRKKKGPSFWQENNINQRDYNSSEKFYFFSKVPISIGKGIGKIQSDIIMGRKKHFIKFALISQGEVQRSWFWLKRNKAKKSYVLLRDDSLG